MLSFSSLLFFSCFLFLAGCSGFTSSEHKKLRQKNRTWTSLSQVTTPPFFLPTSTPTPPPSYPWDRKWVGQHLRIHEQFFRCKGSKAHPPIEVKGRVHRDCNGAHSHGLPAKEGKPFIYPILLDLLNYLQEATHKRVVITCGHRCPRHNTYADPSKKNRTSKHQVGAEVDFYVQGMEEIPERIVELLVDYYQNEGESPSRRHFYRIKQTDRITPCWENQEIRIGLSQSHERRDKDNIHPYPYLTIEVLYDKRARRSVSYFWHKAHYGYFKS